jgi:hypothetical protein
MLSNKDIKFLFEKVMFHSSFKLEDVTVRFATQIDYYEHTMFRKEDGWDHYLIHVIKGDYEGCVMYHKDPFKTLSSMFSPPTFK